MRVSLEQGHFRIKDRALFLRTPKLVSFTQERGLAPGGCVHPVPVLRIAHAGKIADTAALLPTPRSRAQRPKQQRNHPRGLRHRDYPAANRDPRRARQRVEARCVQHQEQLARLQRRDLRAQRVGVRHRVPRVREHRIGQVAIVPLPGNRGRRPVEHHLTVVH